jgi:tetratricopeptide (TPR) repeat protein/DNA-binding CsgD family transcriptional regulator
MSITESFEEEVARSADPMKEAQRLSQLAREILDADPARALKAMRRVVMLARAIGNDRFLADKLTKLADCHRRVDEPDRALECLKEALSLADALPETHIPFLYGSLGRVHRVLGDYPEALWWLQESLSAAERLGIIDDQWSAVTSMADLYMGTGDFRRSLDLHGRSLELAEQMTDIVFMAIACSNLGIIYALTSEYDAARHSFERGLELNRRGGYRSGEASALMNLGELSATLGELDAALAYHRDALAIFREISSRSGEMGCLENIGSIWARRGEHHAALEYYEEALALFDSSPLDPVKRGTMLVSMMKSLTAVGEHDHAERCGATALSIALEKDHQILESRVYEAMTGLHEAKGEFAEALACHRRFLTLKLNVAGEEARKAATAMQARLDIERTEKEREIYRMKSERLELELAHKNRELATVALGLAQKSEIVRRLEKTMIPFASAGTTDASALVRELMPQVRDLVAGGAQWDIFEQQFREAHPEFVKVLLGRCPALTPTEVRVCTLMRVELSNKELADILRSSVRTVENHRRHIRRKLGLGRDANLTTYLASLG